MQFIDVANLFLLNGAKNGSVPELGGGAAAAGTG
jgi:hypothetical protein